jgi:hypothetical protein
MSHIRQIGRALKIEGCKRKETRRNERKVEIGHREARRTKGPERANMKIGEARVSSRKAEQRKNRDEREEMSQHEEGDISRVFDSQKRNDKKRNIFKREGDREAKPESCIEIDKGNTETI